MKRGVVAGVVAVHVVVVAILFQGCGTMATRPVASPPPVQPVQPRQALAEPVLPPGEQKPQVMPALPLPKPPSKAEVKPSLPPPPQIHVVARGESLGTIAKRYGVKQADLAALNRLGNANRLREGQELVIPTVAAQPADGGTEATAAASGAEITYTVQKGDFLGRIASRHGTTVAAIKQLNGLRSDVVRVGQKLKIPKTGAAVPAVKIETQKPVPAPTAPAAPVSVPAARPAKDQAAQKPAAKPASSSLALPAGKPAIDLDAKPVGAPAVETPKAGAADMVPLLVHEVQPNEDLVRIAMMYGVSVDAVKKANGMTGESVRPGQRLKIP